MSLAFPNVLANLVLPLANMIDLAILGHLSHAAPLAGAAIAGVVFASVLTLTNSVATPIMTFAMMYVTIVVVNRSGFTFPTNSLRFGSRNRKRNRKEIRTL